MPYDLHLMVFCRRAHSYLLCGLEPRKPEGRGSWRNLELDIRPKDGKRNHFYRPLRILDLGPARGSRTLRPEMLPSGNSRPQISPAPLP